MLTIMKNLSHGSSQPVVAISWSYMYVGLGQDKSEKKRENILNNI